jgi:hypothetical protein
MRYFRSLMLPAVLAALVVSGGVVPAQEGNVPDQAALEAMARQFAPVTIKADVSALPANERQALGKLVEAGWLMDGLFLRQAWAGNEGLLLKLFFFSRPLV